MTEYDVLIVGGGLVGASLALGLENHFLASDLKIGLIDPVFAQAQKKFDNRTIALSETSFKILRALSASSLDVFKTSPIEQIHISKQGRFAITRLKASDLNLKALGYSVEITTLTQTLYEKLSDTHCELIGTQVKEAHRTSHGWSLKLENTKEISTKLLVAADGDHSLLRKQLDIPVTTHHYTQSAMVTTVKIQKPLNNIAYERFISNGSIALLPIGKEGYDAKLVWIGPTDMIQQLVELNAEEKKQQLKKYMGSRLGDNLTIEDSAFIYPLKSQATDYQVQERFVLMGNAAHVLHPIGAQGFNLSLRDVAILVEALSEAEKDFASSAVLQGYLAQRLKDQKNIGAFVRGLTFLSDSHFLPCLLFNGLELFPFIKKQLMRFAMGSFIRLPRWVYA